MATPTVAIGMTRSPEQISNIPEQGTSERQQSGMPFAVYSKSTLGAGFQELMQQRLAAAVRGVSSRVERLSVRFEDLNGPKGGIDTACRIHLVLSGKPVLVVEGRAEDEGRAFRMALPRLIAALDRQLSRRAVKPRTTLRSPHAHAH
jgi:putative sigma-54 modulation protein